MANVSPYQVAGTKASLYDLLHESELTKQKTKSTTKKQMGKMREEFEKELEDAQRTARNRAKKGKLFSQVLSLAGLGIGPLGAALTSAVSKGYRGKYLKKSREALLDVNKERWGKTFLRDPMKQYWEEAEDLQMSKGDIFRDALMSGVTSLTMSKMLKGDKWQGQKTAEGATKPFTKGLYGQVAEAKKLAPQYKTAKSALETKQLELGELGGDLIDPQTMKLSETATPQIKGLRSDIAGHETRLGKLKDRFTEQGISESALLADSPGWAQFIESFKGIGKGERSVSEGLKNVIMLPLLLQQMIGE